MTSPDDRAALTDEQIGDILRNHWSYQGEPLTQDLIAFAREVADATAASQPQPVNRADSPIDMVLYCPNCGTQHIDAMEEYETDRGLSTDLTVTWHNPPHRSHLCHACETIWRPADVATNGVASIKTEGKADTWPNGLPDDASAQPVSRADGDAVPVAYYRDIQYDGDDYTQREYNGINEFSGGGAGFPLYAAPHASTDAVPVAEVIRMLEGYAESYETMSKMRGGNNRVSCFAVVVDIRQNMIGWVRKNAAPPARDGGEK